jgi:hypothetical protein
MSFWLSALFFLASRVIFFFSICNQTKGLAHTRRVLHYWTTSLRWSLAVEPRMVYVAILCFHFWLLLYFISKSKHYQLFTYIHPQSIPSPEPRLVWALIISSLVQPDSCYLGRERRSPYSVKITPEIT